MTKQNVIKSCVGFGSQWLLLLSRLASLVGVYIKVPLCKSVHEESRMPVCIVMWLISEIIISGKNFHIHVYRSSCLKLARSRERTF